MACVSAENTSKRCDELCHALIALLQDAASRAWIKRRSFGVGLPEASNQYQASLSQSVASDTRFRAPKGYRGLPTVSSTFLITD
jgi:hypothetical protein